MRKAALTPQQRSWVKAGHPLAYIDHLPAWEWTTFSCRVCETGWSAKRDGLLHDPCPHCGTHVGYITKSSDKSLRPDGPGAVVRRRPIGAKPGDTVIMLNDNLFEVTCVVEDDGYVTLPAGPNWTDYRMAGSQGGFP